MGQGQQREKETKWLKNKYLTLLFDSPQHNRAAACYVHLQWVWEAIKPLDTNCNNKKKHSILVQ